MLFIFLGGGVRMVVRVPGGGQTARQRSFKPIPT